MTNHAHVLLCLVGNPGTRMRDVAARVGITERAVQRIVAELEKAGYIDRVREGRVNRYFVNEDQCLRHPVEQHCTIGELIQTVMIRRPLRAGSRSKGGRCLRQHPAPSR